MIRNEKLHLYTCMRSNDAYKGLPHDVFSFTMLQELAARKLEIPIGEYSHYVTSLHIYTEDLEKIELYQKEGWQEKIFMPEMPNGDQTKNILRLLKHERELRLNNEIASARHTEDYWNDLTSLLQIFNISKNNNCDSRLTEITSSIKNNELKILASRKIGSSQANGGNFVYL
ncbi:thymidylate synthase [compost metagenome]